MRKIPIASYSSDIDHGTALQLSRYGFCVFIFPIRHFNNLSVYKSISYNNQWQPQMFSYAYYAVWLSGIKFEILRVVSRLHRGNLPDRINEGFGSLLSNVANYLMKESLRNSFVFFYKSSKEN